MYILSVPGLVPCPALQQGAQSHFYTPMCCLNKQKKFLKQGILAECPSLGSSSKAFLYPVETQLLLVFLELFE